jgi:hypothetical protein
MGPPSARVSGCLKVTLRGTLCQEAEKPSAVPPGSHPCLQSKLVPEPAPGATQPDGRGSKTKVTLLAELSSPGEAIFVGIVN